MNFFARGAEPRSGQSGFARPQMLIREKRRKQTKKALRPQKKGVSTKTSKLFLEIRGFEKSPEKGAANAYTGF
ncbi:MAG: hypothetical protein FWD39_02740 [Clostridiales bacterium]|nr:hypothetical protein [Clostridiales bacterium]